MAVAVQISIVGDMNALSKAREGDFDKFEQELAYRIVDESRRIMDASTPRGRVYRKGTIRGRRTKQGVQAGLRASGKTRMVTGSRVHRASAPGQPIAEDTGRSYRDIHVTRIGNGQYRIRFGGWTGYWEFFAPPRLRRQTILPAIEAAVQKTLAESKIFN